MSKLIWMPKGFNHYFYTRYEPWEGVIADRDTYRPESDVDIMKWEFVNGNCFKTKEEAQAHAKKLKAKLKILNWMSSRNDEEATCFVYSLCGELTVDCRSMRAFAIQNGWDLPFITEEQAEQLIKDLPNELKEYLG